MSKILASEDNLAAVIIKTILFSSQIQPTQYSLLLLFYTCVLDLLPANRCHAIRG